MTIKLYFRDNTFKEVKIDNVPDRNLDLWEILQKQSKDILKKEDLYAFEKLN
jgi:hypothetical protein